MTDFFSLSRFAFHCWLRLDKTGDGSSPKKRPPNKSASSNENSPVAVGDFRRQLYSIYSAAGNGFEAFVTEDGTLTVATASKKEFLAVPLLVILFLFKYNSSFCHGLYF